MAEINLLELDRNKMDGYSGKTALVISLSDFNGESFLRVESEPHYWRKKRVPLSHTGIPNCPKEDLLNDFEFCLKQGLLIAASVFVVVSRPYLSMLSIHNHYAPLIRFDEEDYSHKEKRTFIDQIPLPPWDHKDDILSNDRLMQAIGKRALEILFSYEVQWPPAKT